MSKLEDKILLLRNTDNVTRAHIAELLALVGKPRTKRKEKIEAVKRLNLENAQGYRVEENLEDYEEF